MQPGRVEFAHGIKFFFFSLPASGEVTANIDLSLELLVKASYKGRKLGKISGSVVPERDQLPWSYIEPRHSFWREKRFFTDLLSPQYPGRYSGWDKVTALDFIILSLLIWDVSKLEAECLLKHWSHYPITIIVAGKSGPFTCFSVRFSVIKIYLFCWGWRGRWAVKSPGCSCRGLCWVPSAHMVVYNYL